MASDRTREKCRGGWLAWPIDQHWWFLRWPYVIVVRTGSMPRHLEASLGRSVSIRDMWLEISFSDGRESLPRNDRSSTLRRHAARLGFKSGEERPPLQPSGSFRVIGFFREKIEHRSCAVENTHEARNPKGDAIFSLIARLVRSNRCQVGC